MLIELTLLGSGVMAYWIKSNKRKNIAQVKVLANKDKQKEFQSQKIIT